MSRPLQSKSVKVEWLLAHPDLWQGYPKDARHHDQLFSAMQAAGLYQPTSRSREIDISPLIAAARKARRERRFRFLPKTNWGRTRA